MHNPGGLFNGASDAGIKEILFLAGFDSDRRYTYNIKVADFKMVIRVLLAS